MDLGEQGSTTARHPWEVARAEFFRGLAAGSADLDNVGTVLDVGAGDGWFADEIAPDLPAQARIVCWDINYDAAQLDAPTSANVRRTAERPSGTFDLVLLLDVLEHVADDDALLRDEVVPLLADDGTLLVSVPAHPALFGAHDSFLHHHRRYRGRPFLDLLDGRVEVVSHGSLFSSLLVGRAAQVAAERAGHHPQQRGVGAWSGGPRLTRVATGVLRTDARAGAQLAAWGIRVPGLSHWAVCRKRRS
ncbi:MAG: Methyltransferase type 12 [Ilumatobacteraceae bacterium]|nr:Methyltransferase type 12 [Ilumatobacteraceae bacterium]